jgi:hypothetical protein
MRNSPSAHVGSPNLLQSRKLRAELLQHTRRKPDGENPEPLAYVHLPAERGEKRREGAAEFARKLNKVVLKNEIVGGFRFTTAPATFARIFPETSSEGTVLVVRIRERATLRATRESLSVRSW